MEINYEELTYAIMEAEKSHSLPSTSWRKVGDVILVQVQRPENQGSQWYTFQSKGRRLISPSNQTDRKQKGWIPPSSTFLFYSGPQQTGWRPPHWGGQATLLSPPIQTLIHPETPSQTLRSSVDSEHPVVQPRWRIKLTIATAVSPVLVQCLTWSRHSVTIW